jgi:hypothetical protein
MARRRCSVTEATRSYQAVAERLMHASLIFPPRAALARVRMPIAHPHVNRVNGGQRRGQQLRVADKPSA